MAESSTKVAGREVKDKDRIRTLMRCRRQRLSEAEYEKRCRKILYRVLDLPQFQRARWIHTYCSFDREVDTWAIQQYAFALHKRVMVPVIVGRQLRHVEITPTQRFVPDSFGIPTPQFSSPPQWLDPAAILRADDCIIVPVLAFDQHCYRLGYGRGYYDRFLAQVTAFTVGVAFEFQRWDPQLPVEKHDVPLDLVVTDVRQYQREDESK